MRGKLLLLMLLNSLWAFGQPIVDGDLSDSDYQVLASSQNSNDGFAGAPNVDEILFYADDANSILYLGVKSSLNTGNANAIGIWLNFPGMSGVSAGTDLATSGAGHYMSNTSRADFEVDYMFALNTGSGSANVFIDAVNMSGSKSTGYLGSTDQTGTPTSLGNANVFTTASGLMGAFNNTGGTNNGFEVSIPYSELGSSGLPNVAGLEAFAFVVSNTGFYSDETVPGDVTSGNPGFGPNFGTLSGGPYNGSKTYSTAAATSWSTTSTWSDNVVPPAGANVQIDHNVNLDQNAAVTDFTISSGITFTGSDGTNNYELTVQENFTNSGGTFTASDGRVIFDGGNSISGTTTFGNVDISGGVDFGSGSTISDTLKILAGGFGQTNAPTFGGNSTLTYATGGSYDINGSTTLWTSGSAIGQGVPNNVYVETTTLNIDQARDVTGDLRIASGGAIVQGNNSFTVQGNFDNLGTYSFVSGAGSSLIITGNFENNSGATITLSDQAGGDMQLSGNFTDNGTFTSNDRAVFFVGTVAPQTINAGSALTIDFLQINNSNGVNLNQDLTVNDELTLTAGTLDLNGNSLTLNGSLQRTSGLISASANNSTLVLDNSSSAINLDNAFFDGNLYNLTVNGAGGTVVNLISVENDVTVGSGATLTVNAGESLSIDRDIINDGIITVNDNASLVQTAAGNNNSGSGTFNILRTTEQIANPTYYNYWSSPVVSTTMDDVFGSGSGSNAANPNDWFTWDENNSPDQWVSVLGTDVLTPGKGYISTGDLDGGSGYSDTRTFSGGAVNNGAVTLSVSASSDDFILAGNPYPSAISNSIFLGDQSNLTGTMYFWDHSTQDASNGTVDTNASGDYASWNIVGGVAGNGGEVPDDYVQSCQSFFIQVNATNSVSQIVFENDQRLAGNNNQFFKKETRERVWLNLTADFGESNQILVGLVDQATDGFDQAFDATKFKGNPFVAFYSMVSQRELAIQALDKDLTNDKFIPLGVDAWKTGQYTIALDSLNNWQSANYIYLLDSTQGKVIDLKQNDYTFAVNQMGVIHNRFYLAIGQTGQNNVSLDESGKSGELHFYQKEYHLVINDALSNMALKSARVISLGGVPVLQSELNSNDTEHQLNVGQLAHGVYMLQVEAQDGALHTYKVYLR